MSKPITVLAIVCAAAAASGCSTLARSVGAQKVSPDEFRVVTQAPLTLPPDYNLRPPRPDAPRPQELSADQQARTAVFGTDIATSASPGERAIVSAAGADTVDPNIRSQVDFESQGIVHHDQSFVDRIVNFHPHDNPNATSAPLDAAAAADAEQIRQATGGGQVVIERNRSRGFKLPGT